jgi:hypothetical protein
MTKEKCGKSQSGGPTKSGSGGRPTPPDSGGKVKKGTSFSVQQSGIAKSGLRGKKSLKKVNKRRKQITAVTH